MSFHVPPRVAGNATKTPEGREWLTRLPALVEELAHRWSLTLGRPFEGAEVSAAWVAPVTRRDGTSSVVKLSIPHFEAEHEAAGLAFWDGVPTVRLLDTDETSGAMLLERCAPGTALRARPEEEQDRIIADLLHALWRVPPQPHPFRSLGAMIRLWIGETEESRQRWTDPGLVRDGLAMFEELIRDDRDEVLLATDLHAGNVLSARRAPWLVIDPKPFVGDRSYDATQHLMNGEARMRQAPLPTIDRFSGLLGVDPKRVRRWMFARAAAEDRDDWDDDVWSGIARAIAP